MVTIPAEQAFGSGIDPCFTRTKVNCQILLQFSRMNSIRIKREPPCSLASLIVPVSTLCLFALHSYLIHVHGIRWSIDVLRGCGFFEILGLPIE